MHPEPDPAHSSPPTAPAPAAAAQAQAAFAAEVRASALGHVIVGLISMFLGTSWLVDAPGSVSKEAAQTWFLIDRIFAIALQSLGYAFFATAAWAATGQRAALLGGLVVDLASALLFAAISVEWIIEDAMDQRFNWFALLLFVIAFFGAASARNAWRLYRSARAAAPRD